ncbi:MAG: hypothetical protein Q7U76_12660 [Nitrospirota bacterium]|nr:hypothetical protein [Nitrospirota bacterium]
MNSTIVPPVPDRKLRERAERKRPDAAPTVPGPVTCPLCEHEWNSPDRRFIKFCKRCRHKLPHLELKSLTEDEFIYCEGW